MAKSITHKNFLSKLDIINPNRDYIILGTYTRSQDKILIEHRHGLCSIRPMVLLTKAEITIKSAIDKTNYFISEAKDIHNDFFDYKNVIYRNNKDKVTITCPIHGDFQQSPANHLSGHGCNICHIFYPKFTKEEFIERAIKIHGNLYDYTDSVYLGSEKIVNISCKIHGSFKQKAFDHLSGHGCKSCASDKNGFSKEKFIKLSNNQMCTLYVIHCHNDYEEFYKIGITKNTVKDRFRNSSDLPYKYKILYEYKGSAEIVFEMEKEYKSNLKNYSYRPERNFNGKSECFSCNPLDFVK